MTLTSPISIIDFNLLILHCTCTLEPCANIYLYDAIALGVYC